MRAATYARTGPARAVLEVHELPLPEPGAGEVRVRLEVSGVNPSDVKRRAGATVGAPLPWPAQVPHQDGAGTIDAVGSGIPSSRIGQRVWVYHAAFQRPAGTAAEYVTVPDRQAVGLPDTASFAQGAGLGVPFITAYASLFSGPALTGRTVLVTGGAGAVGNAAIQLATWAGARVVATVSSEQKATLALDAGATVAVDYRADDAEEALAEAVHPGIDHVVDVALASNIASYLTHLRPGAQVVAYASEPGAEFQLPTRQLMAGNSSLRFLLVYHLPEAVVTAACEAIIAGLEAQVLTPLPDHRFPLSEVAAAHEAVESHVTGKVLVELT